jgi:hypothetical protein
VLLPAVVWLCAGRGERCRCACPPKHPRHHFRCASRDVKVRLCPSQTPSSQFHGSQNLRPAPPRPPSVRHRLSLALTISRALEWGSGICHVLLLAPAYENKGRTRWHLRYGPVIAGVPAAWARANRCPRASVHQEFDVHVTAQHRSQICHSSR